MENIDKPNPGPDLTLAAPINRWDEALPLGNGLMGVLVWGGQDAITLSLDRGDLWDLRLRKESHREGWNWKSIQQFVRQGDNESVRRLFIVSDEDAGRRHPTPTKIPAGRLELSLPGGTVAQEFKLDLVRATGHVQMDRGQMDVFCSATTPVVMIRISRFDHDCEMEIIPPDFTADSETAAGEDISAGALSRLGYPAVQRGRDGEIVWTRQQCADGFAYAITVGRKKIGNAFEFAVAVTTTGDGADPVEIGMQRVQGAMEAGYNNMLKPHVKWWEQFWSQSAVSLADKNVERHYYLVRYFYGAASRIGAPPIPLQGVWTADEGTLPPWRGDYHNDLNTQLTYWPYLAAGHLDQGLCFIEFLWELLPTFREYAKQFYDAPGAAVPGTMSLDGRPIMDGWAQYTCAPTDGAWIAHTFYLHWRYTADIDFLRQRAYPFCSEIGVCLTSLLEPDERGKLKLPLSSSPEIHHDESEAWLTPNSNFELSLMRWLFEALGEMASELNKTDECKKWQDILGKLDELAVSDVDFADRPGVGALKLSPDEALDESHRHHSHLIGIHPLSILNIEGSDRDRKIIQESLLQIDHIGMNYWVGYSFPWMACIAARAGQPGRALNMMELFLKGFISRNGFHLNGDFKSLGLVAAKYRPFTLEGNFAFAQAVHEQLLQSWAGVLRIFPAVPDAWADVSFRDLRAEGGFSVSASRQNGKTVHVRIVAQSRQRLQLRNPFPQTQGNWSHDVVSTDKDDLLFDLLAGDCLEGKI